MNAIAEEVRDRDLRDFDPQGLGNIIWAFAVVDILKASDLERMMKCFNSQNEFCMEALHQLAQIRKEKLVEERMWPDSLLNSITEHEKSLARQAPQASSLEKRVWKILQKSLPGFKQQVFLENLYWVDFYHPDSKVVFEVDGPYHAGQKGVDRFKQRQLTALGYHVVRLDVTVWNGRQDKQALLEELLSFAVEPPVRVEKSEDPTDTPAPITEDLPAPAEEPKMSRRQRRKAKQKLDAPIAVAATIVQEAEKTSILVPLNPANAKIEVSKQGHIESKALLVVLGVFVALGAAFYAMQNASEDNGQ
jgi:very-short-patch-repair endonuclease